MKQTPDTPTKQPVLVRVLAVVMTLVFSGLGALSYFSSYTPERSSRFGMTAPLYGDAAQDFGLAIFLIGLLPLALFAKNAKQAGWFGAVIAVMFLVAVFAPLIYR